MSARDAADNEQAQQLLHRFAKYAREDRVITPRIVGLAGQVDDYLRKEP